MRNDSLTKALQRLSAHHGERERNRLEAAIDIVCKGAPLDGWSEGLFTGSAVRLCDSLLALDSGEQLAASTLLGALLEDENHQVGVLGWHLMWQWRVAVDVWSSVDDSIQKVSDSRRSRSTQYEQALRRVLHNELVAYYFHPDHVEHKSDVDDAIRRLGMDHECDVHGVAGYFSQVAAIDAVRGLFAEIADMPGTMGLKTFLSAVDKAYDAADQAGYGQDLRQFEAVRREIERRSRGPRYVSEYHQRLAHPADRGFRFASPAKPSGSSDLDGGVSLPLSADDARILIVQSVVNIQSNHNAFSVRISDDDIQRIKEGVAEASPSVLAKILKDIKNWFIGFSVSKLLAMLFGGQ